MSDPTWQDSIDFLRELHSFPAAQANAITLAMARPRWKAQLIARTSHDDLLFTLPGDDFPVTSMVQVQWRDGISTILRWQNELLAEETSAEADRVQAVLDSVLERLTRRGQNP